MRTFMLLYMAETRFDWRIRVPRTLAAHDFHPEGRVTHTVFAVVEVITPSRSRPTTRPSSPRPSASRNSSQGGGGALSHIEDGTHTPPYEDTVERIKGKRTCMVVHENPNEGVINLDLKGEGVTPGLGIYTQHYTSDIVSFGCHVVADEQWTICALFNYKLVFPDPTPNSTVYAIAISLEQTTSLTSPRDMSSDPLVRTRTFELCGQGRAPAPGDDVLTANSLWSSDSDASCVIEGTGRLPNDEFGRPSTPLG
jgi:hypothetical protein